MRKPGVGALGRAAGRILIWQAALERGATHLLIRSDLMGQLRVLIAERGLTQKAAATSGLTWRIGIPLSRKWRTCCVHCGNTTFSRRS
jgi:hypothetical protein